jgi:hypothetical protein
MLKIFSNYILVFFLTFVSQASVWSNEQSINFSEDLSFFVASSSDKISFSPLHSIEDTKEIVVAEKEVEEDHKNKVLVLSNEFQFDIIQFSRVSCIQYNTPYFYFSNHLYDLFCSWKSFIL